MALTDKLKDIAEGFRTSRGISDKLTLTQMAELAAVPLGMEEQMPNGNILDYIKEEVMEVANKVRNVLTDESIVYLAMSDTHYPGNEDGAWNREQNNEGSLHTAMAAKALAYALPLDFVAHLGDVGNGEGSTTPDEMRAQIQKFVTLFEEAKGTIPCFIAIGNHDPGIYYHNEQTDGGIHTLAGDWLYENFTAYSDSENTVFGGVENGGYCYRDFPDKKLRVFLLNSSERLVTNQYDDGTSTTQQLWVANALKNLGSKSDAAEWQFIVLCHYPLDYGDARPISNVFKAYVKGESITINGTTVSFSGCNGAKFVVQHHGHTHCFKYARLNGYDSSGTMTEYDAWRVAIPNVQYDRENYYTSPYYGVYFCEDKSYTKTPDTANETSFVVNVYNRSENVLYSFCYGAGYDRTISLEGIQYYSIQTNLTGATVSGSSTTVQEGKSYTGTVTVMDGYTMDSVVITMGDKDITAAVNANGTKVYANGAISIQEVTGNVVITAVATKRVNYKNLVHTAINSSNASAPYTDRTYLSSSGSTSTMSGFTTTGFIPIDGGKVHTYRIGGTDIKWNEYGCRIAWYKADFSLKGDVMSYEKIGSSQYYPTVVEDANAAAAFATNANVVPPNGAAYFRLSAKGSGANLIVTIDEPIE